MPPPDWIVADLSFISLAKALPPALAMARPGAILVALVKPQFEVGPALVGKDGIVRDPAARTAALAGVRDFLVAAGWTILGETASPIAGGDGNPRIPDRGAQADERPRRLGLREEVREVEPLGHHRQATGGVARPFLLRAVPVELDAVAVGIGEVERVADAVVGGAVELDAGRHRAASARRRDPCGSDRGSRCGRARCGPAAAACRRGSPRC